MKYIGQDIGFGEIEGSGGAALMSGVEGESEGGLRSCLIWTIQGLHYPYPGHLYS